MRRGTQYGLESDPKDDWRTRAACLDYDPELWFPVSTSQSAAATAKRVCRGCPVRRECLAEGRSQVFGVWGGLTADERSSQPPKPQRLQDRVCEACGDIYRPTLPTHRRCHPCRMGGLQPCGTSAAYRRHNDRGETPCQPCRDAWSEYKRAERARQGRAV